MYLWDSNILRHFTQNHPNLNSHLERVSWQDVALPSVVVAEVLRGRSEFALKALPEQAAFANQQLMATLRLIQRFRIIEFDAECAMVLQAMHKRIKTKKRYPDVMIAAMATTKNLIVVTRNQKHFADLLPSTRLENWID